MTPPEFKVAGAALRTRALAVVLSGLFWSAAAPAEPIDEYQLKAAFVYNIAKFVEWPPQVLGRLAKPIVLCILGESPISAALGRATGGGQIADRRLEVRPISGPQPAGTCQILFVSSAEKKRWRQIAASGPGLGVLTVGEDDSFLADGGTMNLKLERDRIRIQVDVDAAERAGIQISSKLLSLAQVVKK